MISKIDKIKHLGLVFSNYVWDTHLLPFKRLNLVYGWNGSGKTTLSRLFDLLNGSSRTNEEYDVEDENGIKYKQGEAFPSKIRVFNQDYIQNNIELLKGRANSISILLGKENKDLVEKIEADKKLLDGDSADVTKPGKVSQHDGFVKEKGRKETERGSKFTEIAKTIGAAIGGTTLRNYRKPQAESDFVALDTKAELSEADLDKYLLLAKEESLSMIDFMVIKKIRSIKNGDENDVLKIIKLMNVQAVNLLREVVESEVISRLADNPDISQWVEEGTHLHAKHSSGTCEYCQQKISKDRIKQLASHFNEADKKLKESVGVIVEELTSVKTIIESLHLPDRARFYHNQQKDFDSNRSRFESSKTSLLAILSGLLGELDAKKSKTTESVVPKNQPDASDFVDQVDAMNTIISAHNKTTTEFQKVKEDAVKKLKTHYLSTIYDDVKKLETESEQLGKDIDMLSEEIGDIRKRISDNMSLVSSKHKACEEINNKLATFLGHKELTFSTRTENGTVIGYDIMRGAVPAMYLSEGEKTAIAFVYFIVHLGDQDFDIRNGIVAIDDPVSSLDSNSLYQAFSFLKNSVKDGNQVFIFTHSFDFLKLLMNWRNGAHQLKQNTGYYMIKNSFQDTTRCAYLAPMDKELCDYESEYHYLFKTLKLMRDEQDGSIIKAYPMPNIARKVWDTFLMFAVPNGKGPYQKMEELKTAGRDAQKLDAIYKFTNDQSHITGSGFNPALVQEAKKVVSELFEMMQAISPDHFRIIDKATDL